MSSINKLVRVATRFSNYSLLNRTNKLLFFIPNDPRYKEMKLQKRSLCQNSFFADMATGLCVAGTVSFVTGVAAAIIGTGLLFYTKTDCDVFEFSTNCFCVSFIMYVGCVVLMLLS